MCEKTPTTILVELCVRLKAAPPLYESIKSDDPNIFTIQVSAFGLTVNGYGRTKAGAKQAASSNIIAVLKQNDVYKNKIEQITSKPQHTIFDAESLELQNNDPVGALVTFCQHNRLPTPRYNVVSTTGADHQPKFVISCEVDGNESFGLASTKRQARKNAAEIMLEMIANVVVTPKGSEARDSDASDNSEVVASVIPILELMSVEEVLKGRNN